MDNWFILFSSPTQVLKTLLFSCPNPCLDHVPVTCQNFHPMCMSNEDHVSTFNINMDVKWT